VSPRLSTVEVEGGALTVAEWGPADAPAVLAIHGITSSHLAFAEVAAALPDHRIVAVDLRGRGGSRDLPAPFGLRQHALDVARVIEELELGPVTVVAHSMGAFVAVLLAASRPALVSRLVLVDGGFPLRRPEGVDDARLAEVVLGPAAERLGRTFPDRATYREFWRAHPAFAGAWTPAVEAYADYDLVERDGALRPATSFEAMAADSLELYGPDWYIDALRSVRCPVVLLRAPRGLLDEPGGLYPPGSLDDAANLVPQLQRVEVDDVNHYTIVMAPRAAAIVAEAAR
jgi:lipase